MKAHDDKIIPKFSFEMRFWLLALYFGAHTRLLHRSRPWTKSTGYEYNSSRLSLCSHRSQPFEGLVRACQGSHDMAPLITSFPSQMPRNQRQIPVQYCPDIQGTTTRRRKLRKIFFDGALMVISCLLPRVVLAEGSFVASL